MGGSVSVSKDRRGRYVIQFMQGRRRVHRVCPPHTTQAQAKEWETKLRSEVFRVDKLGGLPEYTLQQAIDRYINEYTGKDKDRTAGKARAIRGYVEGRLLGDVLLVADKLSKRTEVTRSTINRHLAILRRSANLAYRKWGWLKEPLGDKIQLLPENPSREVYLSKKEIEKLAEGQSNIQVKAAIYIAAYTGLRSGEILALEPRDIREGVIHVKTSKSGKPRMVPAHPNIIKWLKHLPIDLCGSTLSHCVPRVMPGVRFHDIRHAAASNLLANGVDLYTVSKILGHSSIKITERYSHLQVETLKKAIGRMK